MSESEKAATNVGDLSQARVTSLQRRAIAIPEELEACRLPVPFISFVCRK
jgi:hypothetical protein